MSVTSKITPCQPHASSPRTSVSMSRAQITRPSTVIIRYETSCGRPLGDRGVVAGDDLLAVVGVERGLPRSVRVGVPLLGGVAGQRDALLGADQRRHRAVDRAEVRQRRHLLGEQAVPGLGRLQPLGVLDQIGDVEDDAQPDGALACRADRHAGVAHPQHEPSPPMNGTRTTRAGRADASPVPGAAIRRDAPGRGAAPQLVRPRGPRSGGAAAVQGRVFARHHVVLADLVHPCRQLLRQRPVAELGRPHRLVSSRRLVTSTISPCQKSRPPSSREHRHGGSRTQIISPSACAAGTRS